MKKYFTAGLILCAVLGAFLYFGLKSPFSVELKEGEKSVLEFKIGKNGLYVLVVEFNGVEKEAIKKFSLTPLSISLNFKETNSGKTLFSDSITISGISLRDENGKIYREIGRFYLNEDKYSVEVNIDKDIGVLREYKPKFKVMRLMD